LEQQRLPTAINTAKYSNKTIVLVVASLSNLITTFMMSGVNVALPAINREFHADAIVLSWIITSFVLAVAVFSVPSGRVADIFGIKKIYIYGQLLFTLVSIATLFCNSVTMLIVCRAFQGLSSAMISSTSVAMLTAVFPAKERGRALGISIACVYAGLSIGPFFGGLLIESFNWRSIFIITAIVGFALFLIILWKVKGEWAESRGEKFDYIGSSIYGIALVALMYGFTLLPEIKGGAIILVGILGLIGFVVWEARSKSPILNIRLFQNNKAFVFSNLAALLNYSSVSAITFFLSLYLQYIKGFTPKTAGLVLLAQPVIQTIVAPLSGRLSDKIEPRLVASAGMGVTAVGLLFFGFLSPATPIWEIILVLVVFGGGFGLFASPNTNAIMSSVTPKYYATASSLTGTMRTIGQTLSMGIAMVIMALVIGRVVITSEFYPAFLTSARIAFVIFSILSFAAIFASMARGKVAKSDSKEVVHFH
jgi:EmrB/QacA subfamily drug resistance transporter